MADELSPYLRIAADIERRIHAGELAAGDRVPSTREIVKEWGVAIATATKALGELQSRGAVRAVAGVGTVVAGASATSTGPGLRIATVRAAGPQSSTVEIDVNRIIRTAIGIADAEGFPAVSMRRIAVDLGVPTMSLYRWVSSKDQLLDGMLDEILGDVIWPSPAPDGWRARLEVVARLQWAGYCAHPWLGRIVSLGRPQLAPKAMAHTEWVLSAIADTGLGPTQSLYLVLTLFGYVKGAAATIDAEREAERDTGLDIEGWIAESDAKFGPVIQSGDFPHLAKMDNNADVAFDFNDLFEFGLQRVLDGFAKLFSTL